MLAWKSLLPRLAWSVGITMPSKMIISKYPEFCRCSWPLMTSAGMPGQLWLLWAGSISTPFPFFHSTRSFFLSLSLSDPSHKIVKFSACHWQDLWSLEKSPFCLDPVLCTNPLYSVCISPRSVHLETPTLYHSGIQTTEHWARTWNKRNPGCGIRNKQRRQSLKSQLRSVISSRLQNAVPYFLGFSLKSAKEYLPQFSCVSEVILS